MASARMCGVVLWSSPAEGRAVIWCEDHGKLAFYAGGRAPKPCCDMHSSVALDAGDLIEFDVEDQEQQRRAHNPRLLVPDHAPCIATQLRDQMERAGAAGDAVGHSATVVPFQPRQPRDPLRAFG